jgi:hypothetical protein
MSSQPPNLVGPILQSGLVQRQVARIRDNTQAQESSLRHQQASAIDQQDSTVETADGDTQVHSDAEGMGSQGRAFTGGQGDEQQDAKSEESSDTTEGRHIDLQA